MKKRWIVFRLGIYILAGIYIMLCLMTGRLIITAGTAVSLLSVYWLGYYNSLEYTISKNAINITSGIIFKKHRVIPLDSILWEMRLTSPLFSGSAMTVIHTSGGNAAVFCDFSTRTR